MWPERHWPSRLFPTYHWPTPPGFVQYLRRIVRTRKLLEERWFVTLINAAGTRYELGWCDIEADTASALPIPVTVPDGSYDVEVLVNGLAWESLFQKNTASITIDRTSSIPVVASVPLFTNFTYDIFEGWVRLRWDGDVPLDQSGQVSAGIWLTAGVPNFATDPTVIVPLFSYNSSHTYLAENDGSFAYAGLAPMDVDDVVGTGQYIAIEDRTMVDPIFVVEEG